MTRSHTGNGTPEAHWADYIQQMCLYEENLRLIFPMQPEPYQIALMATLGVPWVVRTRSERRAGVIRGAQRLETL